MERRKALVFAMAIVLVVLAAATLALTATMGGDEPEPSNTQSAASFQVSSLYRAGGFTTST
jgi:flagellar basal body-associated protein FliL